MTNTPRHIGKFEILERLGEGAMGEVFLARDRLLGREVAIKIIRPATVASPDARDRFFREAQASGRLNHPNLVTTHEFGDDQGTLFLVMEFVPGDDLAGILAARELPLREMLELLAQVCDGLAFAHQRGVVHRGIKPTNIRVTRVSGRLTAKILDFGIARLAGNDPAAGALPGAFGYLAPECIQSGKPDPRSDIFAVGVILYEALAGFRPFDGESTAAVLHRIVNEEPAPLDPARFTDISPAIQEVAARALAKSPANRYPTAEALAKALRSARDPWWDPAAEKEATVTNSRLFELPERGKKPAPTPDAGSPVPWLYIGLALVMAALTVGVGWLWIRHRRHRPAPFASQPVQQQPIQQPPVIQAPPPAPAEEPKPDAVKTDPSPAPAQPTPAARSGSYATLDQAAGALDTDPKGALGFLDNLVKQEPENERAIALRIAALYAAGDYRGCALALHEARLSGHPIWPMALKYAPLRKALEQEKQEPRLPRRKAVQ